MRHATIERCTKALLLLGTVVLGTGCDDGDIGSEVSTDEIERGMPEDDIEGRYIVQMKKGSNPAAVASAHGAAPNFVYTNSISGFAATLNPRQLEALSRHPGVLRIEADEIVTIDGTQPSPPWGLDRIDQCDSSLNQTYTWSDDADGTGVNAYVIDTGIDDKHSDFQGRAVRAFDALSKKKGINYARDCNGHGTHVAGTIGGKTHGVAKGVTLRGVRVLGCNGSGTWSQVIAGIDWVAADAAKHNQPAVANLSLGGGPSQAVDAAVAALVQSGVFTVVSAGNSNDDACKYSPARAESAYAVAATDGADNKASFSNWGTCVDMRAPGVGIKSCWLNDSTRTLSGTSMAAPHVTGVAALHLSANSQVPQDLQTSANEVIYSQFTNPCP